MKNGCVGLTVVMLLAGVASAAWVQIGGGTDAVKVTVLEQNTSGTTFEVFVPGVSLDSFKTGTATYARIVLPGGVPASLVVGRPEVPMVPVLLARPVGASVRTEVLECETKTLSAVNVAPLQPSLDIGQPPGPFVRDAEFYARSASYPQERVAIVHTATWHDLDIVNLAVYPVHVNPARKEVVVASRLLIRVSYSGGRYPSHINDWMQPLYRQLVANYTALGLMPPKDYESGTRYLVLCYKDYAGNTDLLSLLAWIRQYGYETELVPLQGGETPEQIKAIVKAHYFPQKVLRWILLVGEYNEVTPKDNYQRPEWAPYVVPWSDYWYSDLNEGSGNYECDNYPEVGVARLSPESNQDLSNQVAKIMNYRESPPSTGWLDRLTLVAHQGPGDFAEVVRNSWSMPLTYFSGWRDTVMGGKHGTNDTVKARIEGGVGILAYLGHGTPVAWPSWNRTGGRLSWLPADIEDLQNGTLTPVVFNVSCSCAYLSRPTCLSEKWMRKSPGGAVASLGSTYMARTEAAYSQCSLLVRATRDYWGVPGHGEYSAPVFDIGGIQMLMDAYIAACWPSDTNNRNIYSFMFLGDPAMPVWSGGSPYPAHIQIDPPVLPLGPRTLGVTATIGIGGSPLENAIVCVWKDGEHYLTDVADENGYAEFYLDTQSEGDVRVSVSEGHAYHSRPGYTHLPMLPCAVNVPARDIRGWLAYAPVPRDASGKPVKDGGWLAYSACNELVYASKGYKTLDFYSYNPVKDSWKALASWLPGTEGKMPSKGSAGCADGNGIIYATKGNNKQGFYKYFVDGDSWHQFKDVPLGPSNKKVKGGTGIVWAYKGGVGHPYLLKGYKNEFYRYDVPGDSWHMCTAAPIGGNQKWDKGSWIVYDGVHTIYAHKARYQEFYAYNTETDTWSGPLVGMPTVGSNGDKKSKDGSCGAYLGGCVYALKGGNTQEFWKCTFTAGGNSWAEKETLPRGSLKKKVKAGGSITSTGQKLFAFKGNKCNELWRYLPSQTGLDEEVTRHTLRGGAGRDNGETPVLDGIEAYSPRWKSDGSAIVVSAEDSIGWLQLWKIDHSGGGIGSVSRLVEVALDCEQPVFNPAGTVVGFTIDDTASGCYQIAVVSAGDGGGYDGSGGGGEESDVSASVIDAQTPASAGPGDACPGQKAEAGGTVCAKPARIGLALARPITGSALEGGEITIITSDSYDHYDPSWSPDGEHLVCTKDGEDGRSHIWCVPATGGEEEQLTFGNNSEEVEPSYLNGNEVVFTLIPDDPAECDQIAKANVGTHDVTVLTVSETDHEAADPAENGSAVVCQALDANGNSQIVKVLANGGSETFLTTGGQGSPDMEEPDWSPDNHSVFCVRWTGITSAICRVDADYGGWTAVTDSSAIRDNPDAWFDQNGNTSYVIFEREAWDEQGLLGFGGRQKRGTGVFKSHYRRPHDGEMGASLGVLALDRIEPNPASSKVTTCWQIPALSKVSLKVYNTAGQLVRVLTQGEVKPGHYTTTWAGTDQQGRRLAAGIYFCALDTGDKRLTRKVVLAE